MSDAKKIKATAEDLKTYNEIVERMHAIDPIEDKQKWEELDKAAFDLADSRDWFTIVIEKDGKEGVKDLNGTVLVPPIFDKVSYLYNRIDVKATMPIIVINGGKQGLVRTDGTGDMLLPCEHDNIYLNETLSFFHVIDNGKTMFVSTRGKQLTPQTMDKVYGSNGSIVVVQTGDKLGLFDISCSLFIEPTYDDIEVEFEEPVIAYKDGVAGYLSADDGHFIPKDEYDNNDSDEYIIFSS